VKNLVNISKIKQLTKEQGKTITYVCKCIGQGPWYLNDVAQEKTTISDEDLSIIADILNTTPEYLRDETDQKEKSATEEKPLPDILYRYNELSEEKQREVISFIEFKLAQQKEKPDDYIGQIAAFGSGPSDVPYNEKAARDLARYAKKLREKEQGKEKER